MFPWVSFAWTAFATVTFVITAWFASIYASTAELSISSLSRLSFANTVITLRILQGVASWSTVSAAAAAFETLLWILASSKGGSNILTLLALSPTTGPFGILKLMFSGTMKPQWIASGLIRLFVLAVCTVGGLILFVNTSVANSCQTLRTFDVLAGTGPFNGSLVKPFLSTYNTTVPYFAIASSYSFISNPQFSVSLQPPSCAGGMVPCDSHLLPGGTYLMWPQINDSVPFGSVVHIDNAPAMRLDFAQGLDTSDDYFSPASCAIYGDGIVALMFCLEKSAIHHGSLKAGVYVCENGVQNGECHAGKSGSTHNVTTTFSVTAYTASSITRAENNTILSVSSIVATEAKPSVDVEALSLAVGWLLNYTAAHLPEQSSVVFGFWETGPASYYAIWQANAYNLLKSTLAFLLWEFTSNNNGNPAVANAESNNQTPDLPAEFHAKASVCQPFTRFVVNEASFIVYSVLHSVALFFCWSVVLMGYWHRGRLPATTSLPMVDFAAKLRRMPAADMGVFHNVGRADTFDHIKASLQNANVGSGKSVAGSIQK